MARKDYLESIYKLIGFPKIHWDMLCKPILGSFNEKELQQVKHVLLIRQSVLLPIGSIAEEIYRKQDIWTYALLISTCQKIKGTISVPTVGSDWLNSDVACTHALELCNASPSTGILAEILDKVFTDDNGDDITRKDNEKLSDKFFNWLNNEIQSSSLKINEPKGMLHIVGEGILLAVPNVFKAFDDDNWAAVMKDFIKQDYVIFFNDKAEVTYNVIGCPGVFVRGLIVQENEFSCESELNKYDINDTLELSS